MRGIDSFSPAFEYTWSCVHACPESPRWDLGPARRCARTWYADSIPPVPEMTAAMVQAAVPRGHRSVERHTAFGAIYDDDLLAPLDSKHRGRRVEVAPWRLALVTVMQYMAGLGDRQAAEAVRRCMDGQ